MTPNASVTRRRLASGYLALIALIVPVSSATAPTTAGSCSKWSRPVRVGVLDASLIHEASGIAASRLVPGRLYHINDSGDSPRFYITDGAGNATQIVDIDGVASVIDVEDLGLGPCPGVNSKTAPSCLYIGDIGDNPKQRDTIRVFVVAEQERFSNRATPQMSWTLRYPDGPHNAEGLAVHPNGDLFILTKEANEKKGRPFPARIYRLPVAGGESRTTEQPLVLEFIGEVDLPYLTKNRASVWGRIATSFDIRPDGGAFVVLTYRDAFEIQHDLAFGLPPTAQLQANGNITKIKLVDLEQQEAISYIADGNGLIYDSEVRKRRRRPPPLLRLECLARGSAPTGSE